MLQRFLIEGFRTFNRLDVAQVGQINLLVGRNNVGKTMFLEALRLYASGGSPDVVFNLLTDREEYARPRDLGVRRYPHLSLQALFHGRPSGAKGTVLRVGVPGDPKTIVEVRLGFALRELDEESRQLRLKMMDVDDTGGEGGMLALEIIYDSRRRVLPADIEYAPSFWDVPYRRQRQRLTATPPFVPARGLSEVVLQSWWDSVSLTDAEQRVVNCLRVLSPVERIALVQDPTAESSRYVIAKLETEREPLPLKALGDGLGRMFWIALALESARTTGILLIDEIENGIHYSALPELWRFVFEAARRDGIQVFATTHSWDCVEAFQRAANESPSIGVLIRLFRKNGTIEHTCFSEEELAVAARDRIEVR